MSKLLEQFVADIFDIYPTTAFLKLFIKDKHFDIDIVLNHPFLIHAICYNFIWNCVYKTYSTKRDFQNYLNANKLLTTSEVDYSNKFIERVLNTFVTLKIGLANHINALDISKQFDTFYKEVNCPTYKQNCIYSKLKYRYNISDEEFITLKGINLFTTFSNIVNAYKPPGLYKDCNTNVISMSTNDTIEFIDKDITFMNEHEKLQYIIYKDNHFLLKLLGNTCVVVDTDTSNNIDEIMNNYLRVYDKNIVLINSDSEWDPTYSFKVPLSIYNILPRITKYFVLITDKIYPNYSSLSVSRENGIIYLTDKITNKDKLNITQSYDRYIISDLRYNTMLTKLNKYLILNQVKMIDYKKSTKTRILCPKKTLNEINEYIKDFDINSSDSYDYVIDFYNEIDILPYMINGAIPILKEKNIYVTNMITGLYIDASKVVHIKQLLLSLDNNEDVSKVIRENCKIFKVLTSKLFNETLWKHHIIGGCPMRSISPLNGMLLYLNFIILYFCKKVVDLVKIRQYNPDSINKVVLIDNRANALSVISMLFTLSNLDEKWSGMIYTSKDSVKYYKEMLGDLVEVVHMKELDVRKFHIDNYNNILKTPEFWMSIPGDKCLIIQDDGILLRKGIDRFMQYDYIGAAWADCVGNEYIKNNISVDLVGNGGFSLRNISKMIEVTTKFKQEKTWLFYKNMTQIPEDVYFVYGLKKIGANMPKYEIGTMFASEEICHYESLGIHKMWAYHMGETVQNYFNKLLQE